MIRNFVEESILRNLDKVAPEESRIGNDFILVEDRFMVDEMNEPFRVQDLTTVIIGFKGTMTIRIDMREYALAAPYMVTIMGGRIIEQVSAGGDNEEAILVFSRDFFDGLFEQSAQGHTLALSVLNNPVTTMDATGEQVIRQYLSMVKAALADTANPHRKEVVKYLTLAMYYGYGNRYMIRPEIIGTVAGSELTDRFLELLREHHKKEHSLTFYADKLCMSDKYLSESIAAATGKSAAKWIDDALLLEAKTLLRCTNMTIAQISDELCFPDQSSFGKFFKRHTGEAPRAFRERK